MTKLIIYSRSLEVFSFWEVVHPECFLFFFCLKVYQLFSSFVMMRQWVFVFVQVLFSVTVLVVFLILRFYLYFYSGEGIQNTFFCFFRVFSFFFLKIGEGSKKTKGIFLLRKWSKQGGGWYFGRGAKIGRYALMWLYMSEKTDVFNQKQMKINSMVHICLTIFPYDNW